MKFVDAKVTFSEVPNEISLCISISGCPGICDGCHSPWLRKDVGEDLNMASVHKLIEANKGISCICFMGGDNDHNYLKQLFYWTKENYPDLKIAWYSGLEKIKDSDMFQSIDYLKIGPYKREFGPLDSPTTNQRFYKVLHTPAPSTLLVDITHDFWKEVKDENSSM